jgi:hypothetical protein
VLAAALIACAGSGTDLADCADAACRKSVALRLWKKDPAGFPAELAAIPDDGDQASAAFAVIEANPGEATGICEVLRWDAAKERCARVVARPHLRNAPVAGRWQPPLAVDLLPRPDLVLPAVPALAAPCADGNLDRACRTDAARGVASTGEATTASGYCMGIQSETWRDECHFEAAEAAFDALGASGVPAALELCVRASGYADHCFAHLAMATGRLAPPATEPTGWGPVLAVVDAVESTLEPVDSQLAKRLTERIWSEATRDAYAQATLVTGDPMSALPEAAHPHIRAAVAHRLVVEGGAPTLDALANLAVAALMRRSSPGLAVTPLGEATIAENLWKELYPGEDALRQVLYLGVGFRAGGDDEVADLRICLLEALARWGPSDQAVLAASVQDMDPVVAWTAARLLSQIGTSESHKAAILASPHELARARAGR